MGARYLAGMKEFIEGVNLLAVQLNNVAEAYAQVMNRYAKYY